MKFFIKRSKFEMVYKTWLLYNFPFENWILLVKIREIKLKLKIINANYQWQINYEIINNNFNKQVKK